MTTLVIHTQYRENYAAHNEDYKHGVDASYWKFKGGSTYFVDNLTVEQVNKIAQNGIPTLSKLIEYSNCASEEYILDWEIRQLGKDGDGKGPLCDSWETPTQLCWGGDRWLAQTNHTFGEDEYIRAPIIAKAEQWIPGPALDRSDYKCQFKTPQGWFDAGDPKLVAQLEAA